jgi:hypothetical protein
MPHTYRSIGEENVRREMAATAIVKAGFKCPLCGDSTKIQLGGCPDCGTARIECGCGSTSEYKDSWEEAAQSHFTAKHTPS